MAIDWKAINTKLGIRCQTYATKVRSIMEQRIGEIVEMCEGLELQDGKPFAFADYPEVSHKVQATFRLMYSEIYQSIRNNITQEWYYSNADMDGLLTGLFGKGAMEDKHFAKYFARNKEAMNQFFARKEQGMNLSQRVWAITGNTKQDMEVAIDLSLGQGVDAGDLSRKVRQYLQEPDMLFRRFRYRVQEPVLDEKGKPVLDKDGNPVMQGKVDKDGNPVYGRKWKRRHYDKSTDSFYWADDNPNNYHFGRGVYRSSYKNAMRLARTETNMAYRAADCERWKTMEFVRGFRVVLSKNHPCDDICNELSAASENDTSGRGEYPKGFMFKGWHPHCYCYCVPLLCTEDELFQLTDQILRGEDTSGFAPAGVVEQPNEHFMQWVSDNKSRINEAVRERGWGSLPYFLQDNYTASGNNVGKGKWVQTVRGAQISAKAASASPVKPAAPAVPTTPQPTAPLTSDQDVADILSTMPTTLPTYDRSIPKDKTGNVDLAAYKQKVADLLNVAGCYTGSNVTILAGFKTSWEVDNWFKQALKFADINGLDSTVAKAQKLIQSNALQKQSLEVVKQARKFIQQFDDYMAAGDYVRANNALKGFINLHDLIKAKVDFGEVSMLMPKELLAGGKWLGTATGKYDKEFFDLFNDFAPVTIKNATKSNYTSYSYATRSVCLNIGDSRYAKDAWYRYKAVYHEFGHALDHQIDLRHNKDVLDLMQRYDTIMQKVKKYNVFNSYAGRRVDMIVKQSMSTYEYADKMLDYYAIKLANGVGKNALNKRLGIVQSKINAGQKSALLDTIASLSKGKHGRGHEISYWAKNKDYPAMEFIAHCFENMYAGNELFRFFYKQLYDDMVSMLKKVLGK